MTTPTKAGPEKIAYQGKMIEVVEQPMQIGERQVTFEFARRAPGTRLIIPTKDNTIILSKEFRTEINGYDYRLPGGKVFDTLKEYNEFLASNDDIREKALQAAIKEAREEVGVIVEKAELFAISKCGVTIEWDLYYFVVRSFTEGERTDSGEGEDITAVTTPIEEAKKMCLDGRFQEERSALILLRYLNR